MGCKLPCWTILLSDAVADGEHDVEQVARSRWQRQRDAYDGEVGERSAGRLERHRPSGSARRNDDTRQSSGTNAVPDDLDVALHGDADDRLACSGLHRVEVLLAQIGRAH